MTSKHLPPHPNQHKVSDQEATLTNATIVTSNYLPYRPNQHKVSDQEAPLTNATNVTSNHAPSVNSTPQSTMQLQWGSFQCQKKKMGKRCDLCDHMIDKSKVESLFFKRHFTIHGHLAHDHAPEGKIRWFVYHIIDVPCQKEIIGSTTNPNLRWANYKSCCNRMKSNGTGLCKHFMEGCPNDKGDGCR